MRPFQEFIMRTIEVLLSGFFGSSSRGFLGWGAMYLVNLPSGRRLIFDTAGYNERGTITKLLEQRGIGVAAIEWVVLSHLHFDHAANWDLFPNANIVVHEKEIAYAQATDDTAIIRYHAPALLANNRLHLIREKSSTLENGVQVLHVPGHTPGAIALTIEDSVFSGDALKSRWDLRGELTDTWNVELARQSIQKITRLGNRIYPGHDMPLERHGSDWVPCGIPSVRLLFPDGSEQVIEPPAAQSERHAWQNT
jgi:glyoxylase-like metal-dependent hydrolase (beta-lactamase superfamily II)